MPKSPPPRARRHPDEARRLILDAALRLFAGLGPDAVGLKDVAREAGVSHALVTHYFKTYDGLVAAAFFDHIQRARADVIERLPDLNASGARAWIDITAAHLGHPVYGRLVAWALLGNRAGLTQFFPSGDRGLGRVADLIAGRLGEDGSPASRADVEFSMLLIITSLMGYTLAGRVLWTALGKQPTAEREQWFRERLAGVLDGLGVTHKRKRSVPRRAK
jgi:TetR/AcrR family transcriptional regulator, repressor for neighboring sulfatase